MARVRDLQDLESICRRVEDGGSIPGGPEERAWVDDARGTDPIVPEHVRVPVKQVVGLPREGACHDVTEVPVGEGHHKALGIERAARMFDGDADQLGVPAEFGVIEVAIAEYDARRHPDQFVDDLLASDVAEVKQTLGPGRAQRRDGVTRRGHLAV